MTTSSAANQRKLQALFRKLNNASQGTPFHIWENHDDEIDPNTTLYTDFNAFYDALAAQHPEVERAGKAYVEAAYDEAGIYRRCDPRDTAVAAAIGRLVAAVVATLEDWRVVVPGPAGWHFRATPTRKSLPPFEIYLVSRAEQESAKSAHDFGHLSSKLGVRVAEPVLEPDSHWHQSDDWIEQTSVRDTIAFDLPQYTRGVAFDAALSQYKTLRVAWYLCRERPDPRFNFRIDFGRGMGMASTTWDGIIIVSKSTGQAYVHMPDTSLELDDFCDAIKDIGPDALAQLLTCYQALAGAVDTGDGLMERIRRAVRLFEHAIVAEKEVSFVLLIAGLESIVADGSTHGVTRKLRESIALLLGSSQASREKISSEIDYLYTLRSKMVHEGRLDELHSNAYAYVMQAEDYLRAAIRASLRAHAKLLADGVNAGDRDAAYCKALVPAVYTLPRPVLFDF